VNRTDSQALHALRDKYVRILALRTAHDRAKADTAFVEPDPRAEMAKLATEFPGALRELDTLALDVVAERIVALDAAVRDPSVAEPWMIAQVLFHRTAREMFSAKRWLGGRKTVTDAMRSAFTEQARESLEVRAEDLDAIAAPPNGRVTDLVYARVATALEVPEREARTLVFGPGATRHARLLRRAGT
jgi:hypothetical protein